jgi:hypothetical protein
MYAINEQAIVPRDAAMIAEDISELEFYAPGGELLVYDPVDHRLLEVSTREKQDFQVESQLVTKCGSEITYCPTPFDIRIGCRWLCGTEAHILAIAASDTFRLVVYATSDNFVHFCSTANGTPTIRPLDLQCLITRILITEKWGFVLLQSEENVWLYNVNGTLIKEARIPSVIARWTTFSSDDGFDYVAYADAESHLAVFEAFFLGREATLPTGFDEFAGEPLSLEFDRASQRLIIVTTHGDIAAVTYLLDVAGG